MMNAHTVLVIDDEADLRMLYATALERRGWRVILAANVAQARTALTSQPNICAVLTDMRLPDGSGMDVLAYIKLNHAALPVTVITAYGGVAGEGGAVEAMRAGAFDYLAKPVNLLVLRERVAQMIASSVAPSSSPKTSVSASTEQRALPSSAGGADITQLLPGDSPVMKTVQMHLLNWARTQAPVVLGGESGTGKELAARALHACSARAAQAFVAVNCGAIPEQLMEAEFFGVRKGAFTGAVADREGFFQAAHGGTLLLDEVADLPLVMQVKLLRVLQERCVRRVGGTEEEPIDVRIVAASHKNLAALVASGQFRQDLYYRLNVMQLTLPPLRERGDDVLMIARHWIAARADGAQLSLRPDAQTWLKTYAFPGNVRELENLLERAAAYCTDPGAGIGCDHLLPDTPLLPVSEPKAQPKSEARSELRPDYAELAPLGQDAALVDLPKDLVVHLAQIERRIIEQALIKTRYNRTHAAALLGLNLRQLRYRIEQLGIAC